MGEFATISDKEQPYPKTTNSTNIGDSDPNSAGFLPTRKVQTGQTRGDIQVKGKITVADSTGVVRLILGYDPNKF